VKTFVLEKGNNSLFAGCLSFNLYGLCSMKDNSINKNEITAIIPSILYANRCDYKH
jgi:hypothetical protein